MTKRTKTSGLSRRELLKATSGTAALLAAAKLNFPAGAFAQGSGPEVKGAKLGFIALTDASPLFAAKEKGIFAKYGMPDVEVQKQASWGTTRDNLVLGSEGPGLSHEAKTACDVRVTIPMAGADSLNVATAGAILLHHLLTGR